MAIVTGAGSGIGKAVSILYASEGAKVVVTDIDENGGNGTVNLIKSNGGEAFFIKADTSNPDDQKSMVEKAVKKYGGLHIACNNAGIGGELAPTGEYSIDAWDKIISVNLSGVFYGLRYQIPAMLTSGEGGSIVNMASILGMVGSKNVPGYVAAKHGVVGLTKTAALDYADKQIRINAVGPGYIDTPLLSDSLDEDTIKSLAGLHPIGRLGTSEEVAELVLWLSSSKSSFVTGSYYTIDGGYTTQ
ncbi:glucose 1-dehydrogenase [uncultured Algoriphagus sp.]|uniref:glucose 1-dehydrogenase n=1 Tax=uncultured Algoriphagus sp. TaxID=417365 RepID=UPI0030EBF0AB